jgi:hypothetical protein
MCSDKAQWSNTMKYLYLLFDKGIASTKNVHAVAFKVGRGIAAMWVMANANCEQRNLFLFYCTSVWSEKSLWIFEHGKEWKSYSLAASQ